MRKTINILTICNLIIIFLSISVYSENNEKSIILNSSSFGDWKKAKKIKKSDKILLQPWDKYINYAKSLPEGPFKRIMLKYDNKINIDYDEIWIWERDDVFNKFEKKKFRGQFDIHKLYWKNNKVRGFTLEKYYISDPITKKKVGKHKVTQVWDRDSILREISK